ncbi:acetyl-CoA carboxylase biotin carboxyl carrier protein subunit [Mesobacillus foraminis]|uniref:acetyl-CoA carboxylase biotin carboxyl carrier protein subunit n=1 Tax=Mesobacillus foraminis TaxID=279826 RepID=UPI001BE5A491|nr:acetyl-CoA carboxylase biotin carboxyl carrier protein subunit [Mesobacillus foraminis]MBT2755270.1 acetyl-CoA carboxylase biotin carboxyl carrier protein subunit [Mesobacillus foraminis]
MSKIEAGMAGSVWKILVKEGDEVKAGQEVVILESMKMEIPVGAETDGTVTKVHVQEGDFVNDTDVLLEVE